MPNVSPKPAPLLRILGVDPGLNITGYGVLEVRAGRPAICEAGVVRGKTKGSLTARLHEIHLGVARSSLRLSRPRWRSSNSTRTTSGPAPRS